MVKTAFTWEKAPSVVLFFFCLPFIVYMLGGQDNYTFGVLDFWYRFAQIVMAGSLGICAYMYASRYGARFSPIATFIALFLTFSLLLHLSLFMVQQRMNFNFEVWKLTVQFLFSFLALDLIARRYSFETFARVATPIAFLLIVMGAVHTAFFAERIWGRALFFGLHPNLGGELLFGSICIVAFSRYRLVRLAAYALAFYAVMQLQARSAAVAIALVAGLAELPRNRAMLPQAMLVISAMASVLALALLLRPDIAQAAIDFVAEDVLRLNDPYRGAGTGFAGREDTFEEAFRQLFERPLSGSALLNSDRGPIVIHNGYLRNLAEFGVPGLLVNFCVLIGMVQAFRYDRRLGAVVAACAFMYLFGARNFSLNIFPFLLWIAILPWAKHTAENEKLLLFAPRPLRMRAAHNRFGPVPAHPTDPR